MTPDAGSPDASYPRTSPSSVGAAFASPDRRRGSVSARTTTGVLPGRVPPRNGRPCVAPSVAVAARAVPPAGPCAKGGKEGSWVQADIDALLVRLCADGKRVVRLKGGCPSVFSRAHSEIAALADAGWCAELVPGISSALAAPLAAGITLTDRDLGRHFSVASAHDPDGLDFDAFRGIDTCVFLMVGRSLARVAAALTMDAGKGEDVPVAVIRWGCTPREEVYRGTLGTIAGVTAGRELSPCVMVVGEVAAMGRETR